MASRQGDEGGQAFGTVLERDLVARGGPIQVETAAENDDAIGVGRDHRERRKAVFERVIEPMTDRKDRNQAEDEDGPGRQRPTDSPPAGP